MVFLDTTFGLIKFVKNSPKCNGKPRSKQKELNDLEKFESFLTLPQVTFFCQMPDLKSSTFQKLDKNKKELKINFRSYGSDPWKVILTGNERKRSLGISTY